MSAYYLERASVHHLQKHFNFFEEEARSLLASGLAIPAYVAKFFSFMFVFSLYIMWKSFLRCSFTSAVLHARYDQLLKTSHAFNILDSRGFVGVTERARYFSRMRR